VARLTLVLATRAHLRQEIFLGQLHIVNQNHAKLVFLGQIKQAHQSLGENTLSLAIPKLWKPEMLIKSVENDKPDTRKLLKSILELVVKVLLLSLIKDPHIPDLRKYLVKSKLILIALN
jgi:hypothetical protein